MQSIYDKAKHIRLAIFDVDGVLTNGTLYYGPDGPDTLKTFNVRDGQAIKFLQKTGITVAVITARESKILARRMQDLDIQHFYCGNPDKVPAYEEIKQNLQLTDDQICYTGDDLPDLPLMRRAGLAFTVADAPKIIHQYASWVTKAKGGKGAVREICELIMHAQGSYQGIIDAYLHR